MVLDLELAERSAGQLDDLQGPDDPPAVVGMQPRRGRRVERRQPGVQRGVALGLGLLLQPSRSSGSDPGPANRPAEQRLEVQRRAADEEDRFPRPSIARDGLARPAAIIGHAGRFPGLDHVDQVVRDTAALGHRRLGGADVHPPVDRRRVHGDDLGIQPGASATPTAVLPEAVGPVR